MATDSWGIEDGFHDAFGAEQVTSDETRGAILRAMGRAPDAAADPDDVDIRVVRPGGPIQAPPGATITLDNGGTMRVTDDGTLPADLPFGYHYLDTGTGRALAFLITSPGACYLPDDLRTWGWAVQLYAARSRDSWGIGDLADLRALGAWTRAAGGGAVMVNPLSAPAPTVPLEASPYYPSSRRYRNPLYLRIEELPGASDAHVAPQLALLAGQARLPRPSHVHAEPGVTAARGPDPERWIDRDSIYALKMRALDLLFHDFAGDPAFDAYQTEQGDALAHFAAYATLAERYGKDWRRWPGPYRHPAAPAVARLIVEDPRVRFHAWVQWRIDQQLHDASKDVLVIHDLPVGFDVAGADGWCWQDIMASDISIGCPPDPFNLGGQDWGLAPFIPTRLRAAHHRPFIETIRATLRHAGGIRIDHVMGLGRLFWIPRQLGARGGTYVHNPAAELMAIIAIESQRARAIVVGEDLGTVVPATQAALAAHKMLSYRLLFFEPGPPEEFPENALGGVTTHDLATLAGIWSGKVIDHAVIAGVTPNETGLVELKAKIARLTGLPLDAPVDDVIVASYAALARAPTRVLLATLEDAARVEEQPNMPGTTTTWPNWAVALPQPIEELMAAELPARIGRALTRPR